LSKKNRNTLAYFVPTVNEEGEKSFVTLVPTPESGSSSGCEGPLVLNKAERKEKKCFVNTI
jgi:hypothetical protein